MLESERIHLRLLEEQDLPARVRWFNDPEVIPYLVSDYPTSLARTRAWFQKVVLDPAFAHFSIIDRASNEAIGMTGLLNIDRKHRRAQFYLTIGAAPFRGKRIPDETIPLVLDYAFRELGLNKVYLWTIDANARARTVYERNGFVQEALMREHYFCRGEFQTLYQHGITRGDFDHRLKSG